MGTEFQGRSQFEVHGAQQVILREQQQSLSVDLLGAKLPRYALTAWRGEKTETGMNRVSVPWSF